MCFPQTLQVDQLKVLALNSQKLSMGPMLYYLSLVEDVNHIRLLDSA